MKQEHVQYIRDAMSWRKGDDLERAEHAFAGMSDEQLDQQWGQSGRSCREVLEDYRKHRKKWKEAMEAFEKEVKSGE